MPQKEERMKAHVDAVLRELPFLKRYYSSNYLKDAKVQRVDLLLLEIKARYDERNECLATDVRFFGETGKCVGMLGVSFWSILFSCLSVGFVTFTVRETIREAIIQRIRKPIRYVVMSNNGILYVYKAPRGNSLKKWIDEEIRREREVVKATIDQIDSKA